MTEFALILVSTILVNNFVLSKFLGLCPFMGVSRKLETATGMGLATTFVLTLAAVASWGLGTVLFKRTEWSTPLAVTTGWLLVIGAVAITAGRNMSTKPTSSAGAAPAAVPALIRRWTGDRQAFASV